MKARLYKDRTNGELLRYYQKILRDAEDCKKLAQECGTGPAAEHFLKGAKTATMEAEQVRSELEYRGLLL